MVGPCIDGTEETAFSRADFWLSGAILQGERLLRLIETQSQAGPPESWTKTQRDALERALVLGGDHLVEELEGHFFVGAVRNAHRWLSRLAVNHAELRAALEHLREQFAHACDLRDMWEHEDEYLGGGGRRVHRYRTEEGTGLPWPGHRTFHRCAR